LQFNGSAAIVIDVDLTWPLTWPAFILSCWLAQCAAYHLVCSC